MATVCVKNVPEDLYEALRRGAKANRRSIAAEFRALLEETYPTKREIKAPRKQLIKRPH
jgi:plasmid stability protein